MGRETDRDRNVSWNIYKITKSVINKKVRQATYTLQRPSYVCWRSNQTTLSIGTKVFDDVFSIVHQFELACDQTGLYYPTM